MRLTNAEAGKYATMFSELTLMSAAIGRGQALPEEWDCPSMLFTSAIHPDILLAFDKAEAAFVKSATAKRADAEAELEMLEAMMSAVGPAAGNKAGKSRLKDLKRELSKLHNVTWREHDAHRSSMIEILGKSAYGHMTLLDPYGSRMAAAVSLKFKMTTEASWLSLTSGTGSDHSFVRSSTSGGATIHALSGSERPTFQYISLGCEDLVAKMAETVKSKDRAAGLKGHAIILPVPAEHVGSPISSQFTVEAFGKAMRGFLAYKADDLPRQRVGCVDDEVQQAWDQFLRMSASDILQHSSPHLNEAMRSPALSARTAACAASRAIAATLPEDGHLTGEMLEAAKLMAAAILMLSNGLTHVATRAANAEKAREAKKVPDVEVESAAKVLIVSILSAPNKMVSRKQALSIKHITPTVLQRLVDEGRIHEVAGKEVIRMGTTTRAYTMPAPKLLSEEESVAEFEAATDDTPTEQARCVYNDLCYQAEMMFVSADRMLPFVRLDEMTVKQIQALPTVLRVFADRVCLRAKEPDTLDDAEDAGVKANVPNLWFRYRSDGKRFCNWEISARLGFSEQWKNENEQ